MVEQTCTVGNLALGKLALGELALGELALGKRSQTFALTQHLNYQSRKNNQRAC